MVWYADGSIQVEANGQVATGTGTAFLKNVRIGDGLTIAGSASMHEVTNIASDTQLTFSPPFTGAAGAGKQYRIAPIQGYVKEAADRLREVLREVGPLIMSEALQALAEAQTDQERRAAVGLGKVDNTADVDKPVSRAMAEALAGSDQKNADLVTQAEAEAGTGTGIRSWPVVRVWQAAAGWWNASAMKTKLDSLQKTGGTTDSTVGALLKVGDFGVGSRLDLRNSLFTTGKPSDLFGRGFLCGLSAGGELGIPSLTAADYGVLTINVQWSDASAGHAIIRRFSSGNREWVQYSVSANAWGSWTPVITSRSAVGPVSRASGENSGSIIESSSNANGKYTKFAGGDQWCSGSLVTTTIPAGGYIDASVTFPAQFAPDDICVFSSLVPYGSWGYQSLSGVGNLSINGVGTLRAGINGSTAQQFALYWAAKGRWFV